MGFSFVSLVGGLGLFFMVTIGSPPNLLVRYVAVYAFILQSLDNVYEFLWGLFYLFHNLFYCVILSFHFLK